MQGIICIAEYKASYMYVYMYKGDCTIKRMLIRSCRKLVVLKSFFVGGLLPEMVVSGKFV